MIELEGRKRIPLSLDMAPLIDIVFLLLIFFILTSSFLVQESIDVVLPESKTAKSGPEKNTVVAITENGDLFLDGVKVELSELNRELRRKNVPTEKEIFLQSDRNAKVFQVIGVMDELRAAGFEGISLATRRDSP